MIAIQLLMLRIGPVQLSSNLLLAPIAGYCDLAFRLVCRAFNDDPAWLGDGEPGGLGLACTDLLSPQGLLRGTAQSLDLAKTNDRDKPVGMQLYGCDPEIMGQGAVWALRHGATVIDINMGCPVDKVTKKDGGSRLLCDPERAVRIVEGVVRAVDPERSGVPVTCKMRLGWFDGQPVAKWLAPRLVEAGAAAITVHGRTTEQKFRGSVDLAGIAEVVEGVRGVRGGFGGRVPVIGNGDVTSAEDVVRMLAATGCDGVMIGRGALSRPWLFRDAWTLQVRGRTATPPSVETMLDVILRFFALMREQRGDHYAMYQIRRRISWFGKPLPESKSLRESIRLAADPAAVHAGIEAYRARVDDTRGSWSGSSAEQTTNCVLVSSELEEGAAGSGSDGGGGVEGAHRPRVA